MAVKILLKQTRKKRRISQNKLAQMMDMTLQAIQKIEAGKTKSIPFDTLEKLCIALKCEVSDIFVIVPNQDPAATSETERIDQSSPASRKRQRTKSKSLVSDGYQYRQAS